MSSSIQLSRKNVTTFSHVVNGETITQVTVRDELSPSTTTQPTTTTQIENLGVTATPEILAFIIKKAPINLSTPKTQKRKPESDVESSTKKVKHTFIEPERKLAILALEKKGTPISRLAKDFGVGEQKIRDWKKNKAQIEKLVESNTANNQSKMTSKG